MKSPLHKSSTQTHDSRAHDSTQPIHDPKRHLGYLVYNISLVIP